MAQRLEASGCRVVARAAPKPGLLDLAHDADPSVVVIDAAKTDSTTLELINQLARGSWPLVIFADESDGASIQGAIQYGVAGFVVNGAQQERLRAVLDVATARHAAQRALLDELRAAKTRLAERKLIDRAKGLLMEKRGLSENDAFAAMRKMAMDKSIRLGDVALRVIELEHRL